MVVVICFVNEDIAAYFSYNLKISLTGIFAVGLAVNNLLSVCYYTLKNKHQTWQYNFHNLHYCFLK